MIAKHVSMRTVKKSNYRELVNYLLDPKEKAERVGQITVTNCHTDRAHIAVTEVLNTQAQNRRSQTDSTYHLIFSFPPGERPDAKTLQAIEKRLCDSLGYRDHQRVSVVHHDTDSLHVHVAINMVHPGNHKKHTPYRDYKTLAEVCTVLEQEYGLQATNHVARKRGPESRAVEMEARAGVESLTGWIQRECGQKMQGAQSWAELHEILREHGLQMQERGNGLVLVAEDGTAVKASAIGREYSKRNLERRLGAFEQAREVGEGGGKRYAPRPVRSRANTAELYGRYRQDQQDRADRRAADLTRARDRAARAIEDAKAAAALKRAAIRLLPGGGLAKRVLYSQASATLQGQVKDAQRRLARERARIGEANPRRSWVDWLQEQAGRGDAEALAALRCRPGAAPSAAPGAVDGITKRGTIVYRVGAAAVRDDGQRLTLSRGADRPALEAALRVAAARGPTIKVTGTAAFQSRVVEAAASCGLAIRFADPALEQRRQQLTERGTHDRPDPGPAGADRGRRAGASAGVGRSGPESGRAGREPAGHSGQPAGPAGRTVVVKPDVAGIGRAPPPQAQHRLRALSELGMVHFAERSEVLLPGHVPGNVEHKGAKPDSRVRRDVSQSGAGIDAAKKYVAEREQKRTRGIALPEHKLCEPGKYGGPAAFAGIREIDGQRLALMQQGETILVLPIDVGTAQRLTRVKVGDAVSITPAGGIRTGKGRSR